MRCVSFLVALALACGDDDGVMMMMPRDAGPPPPGSVTANPIVALEGHENMVIEIFDMAGEAAFEGATVMAENAGGPVDVLESVCAADRCAARLRVRDTRPNLARPFPQPIDGIQVPLLVVGGPRLYRANVNVRPLDTISNSGGMGMVNGAQIASSIDVVPGASFTASAMGPPVRWIIFGGGRMSGTYDFTPTDGPTLGGGNGGAIHTIGFGSAPGSPGLAGAGGGGGGTSIDGNAGTAADGTEGGGGAGGIGDGDVYATCVGDFGAETCGGSGGGGATGTGGHGGGAFLVVSLAPLDVTGATVRIAGGPGMAGGGGGGGGSFILAAPSFTGFPLTVDMAGGAGSMDGTARGGDGAVGRARLEAPVATPAGWIAGPSVDLAGLQQITREPTLPLRGRGDPGTTIRVRIVETPSEFSTMVMADGTWSVNIELQPGLNRLAVRQTDAMMNTAQSWSGTNILFGTEGMNPTVLGATVDLVYLP